MSEPSRAEPPPELRRELGRFDLTAIGINIVIGAGIFLVPSQVAVQVGAWSPLLCVAMGLASLSIGLCFAEVSSRFEGTGGPYLYTRVAYGRFFSFQVGWMYWFTRVAAQASVMNGLALVLAQYWPAFREPLPRALLLVGLTTALAWINVRGIKQAAWVVNALTISKLLPLSLFIVVGLAFVDPSRLVPSGSASWSQVSTGALLLLFIVSGYEVVPVQAGEARHPRSHAPFAVVATILITTLVNTLVVVVCLGTLSNLAGSSTPVSDAARVIMGPAGAALIAVGTVLSIAGNNAGQILTASRMLFALAENGDLPRPLGVIHRPYQTPANAIVFTATVAVILALTGSFAPLAAASAVSRLLTFVGVCAATLSLRKIEGREGLRPASFVTPGGTLIPALALLVCALILSGVGLDQLRMGTFALLAGGVLFLLAPGQRRISQHS